MTFSIYFQNALNMHQVESRINLLVGKISIRYKVDVRIGAGVEPGELAEWPAV